MKHYYAILIAAFAYLNSFSQQNELFHSDSCRYVLKELSYFWKLDSLANNGFRLYVYERFLRCKLNNITTEELNEKLGKPDKVNHTNNGTEYIYFYYNGDLFRKMPNMLSEQLYLIFRFKNGSKYLELITEGIAH